MAEFKRPSLTSGVYYQDPRAALDWLEKAFGFEPSEVLTDSAGNIAHAQMSYGDGVIMVGCEYPAWDWCKSPASAGGKNTQSIHLQVESGLDALFERARQAGAKVLREPVDQFYGDRSAMVADPEGHIWSFGQTLKEMSYEEMKVAGNRIDVRERL